MAKLEILTYPNKFLTESTKPLEDIDSKVQEMIDQMATTMYAAPGVGLAAIQVGWNRSLLVYDVAAGDEQRALHVLVNPKIIVREGEIISENEGCLSVPELRADVKRAAFVTVAGFDREGKPIRFDAEGLLAIVLQHEIDHLNGVLFTDLASRIWKPEGEVEDRV